MTTVETMICFGVKCSFSFKRAGTVALGGRVTATTSDSFTASALTIPVMLPCISAW